MTTNLECKERERQRKREEGGTPAKLNEKKGDRDIERDIKKGDVFFLLVAAVTKCERPIIKYKVKMSGGEKK